MSGEVLPFGREELFIDEEKPWLRKVGGHIVRFVRESAENPGPTDHYLSTLRRESLNGILRLELERNARVLTEEWDYLRSLGISVVDSSVSVCPVPLYDEMGHYEGKHLGLKIVSKFVEGTPLNEIGFSGQKYSLPVSTFCDTLRRYVDERQEVGKPIMKDIFQTKQYIVEPNLDITLIDVDPFFLPVSNEVYNFGHGMIDYMEESLRA